jgi:leishmanolysin
MSVSKILLALSVISLSSVLVYAHDHSDPIMCKHDTLEFNPDIEDVDESLPSEEERILATYPGIRIYAHYATLTGTPEFNDYIKNELIPPIISLLQAALKIKYPLSTPLKATPKTLCSIPTPSILTTTGVTADYAILLTSDNTTGTSWVASASSCLVSSGVKRPLISRLTLNSAAIKPVTAESNPLGHEYNMYVLMHEIFHGLGFSQNFFSNYVDAQGNLLKNHIKKVLLTGTNRTVLDLPPLTQRLRNFYGCPTLEGAFMEDDGGSGTAGSHWERKFFPFDLLSSGAIHGRKITEFTLAYLEGTGWYVPDYSYAEPFFFGRGAGCEFIYQTCNATATESKFQEFCTGNGRECTEIGNGGGFCKTDICTDNCKFATPQFEYNCENPNGVYYSPFAAKQVYGRGLGSKCFSGNLSTGSAVAQTTYCFKYTCTGTGLSTSLEVMFGTTKLICAKEGPLAVSGYKGQINCPDPIKFCNTIGKPYCPRGCSGRGKCVSNKCVCNAGFKGVDCAFRDI